MTGKPTGAWNKPSIKLPKTRDDSSFPGLTPASASSPEIATKLEYEERQKDEVLALEAIYGEDFVKHTQTHSVWKVSTIPRPHSHPLLAPLCPPSPIILHAV